MTRLLFVVNVDWFFLSHRLPIAIHALKEGFEVHVACATTGQEHLLEERGIIVHPLPVVRGRTGTGNVLALVWALFGVFSAVRPDITHLVTIKPVLLGGIVARMLGVKRVVAAISGLGYVFISQGVVSSIRRFIIGRLYWLALHRKSLQVVFQNADDCRGISEIASLAQEQTSLIKGSGVDLDVYAVSPEPDGLPVVVMPARLLRDKGVVEFCDAAHIVRQLQVAARFCLVGDYDPDNPAALSSEECEAMAQVSGVELWGFKTDMSSVFSSANLVVLPSYREGLPKALIEAAACGRAIVTTDVPGCRDAIEPGKTGLLVPVMDSLALSDAIVRLLKDPEARYAMGVAGRKLAEREFDVNAVVRQHMEIYEELLTMAI